MLKVKKGCTQYSDKYNRKIFHSTLQNHASRDTFEQPMQISSKIFQVFILPLAATPVKSSFN